jgi:hypothetical protein
MSREANEDSESIMHFKNNKMMWITIYLSIITLNFNGLNSLIKSLELDAQFYQIFQEEITAMLIKLFYKIESKGILPNSFYESSITLVQKL